MKIQSTVEARRHINNGERKLLSVWKPCPVFDAWSAALQADKAEWRRLRAIEAARRPDCESWED